MVLCVNYVHGYLDGIKWRYRSCSRLSLFDLCKLWLLIVHTRSSRFVITGIFLSIGSLFSSSMLHTSRLLFCFFYPMNSNIQRVLRICWSCIPSPFFHVDISLCKSVNDPWSVDPHIPIIVCQIYAATHTYMPGRNSLVSTYWISGMIYKEYCMTGVANCLCGHESCFWYLFHKK